MKRLFLLLILCMQIVSGCGLQQQEAVPGRLQVMASFYPMGEFAKAVGGDYAQVNVMVPDGVEPHDWEPSPRDLTRLGRAQVFVYNGLVEPWAEQALAALSERPILAVQAGADLYGRQGKQDPHVWISPRRAMAEVERITEAFCQADPAHAAAYRANSQAYLSKLQALDCRLQQLGTSSRRKVFVTAHSAFGHLAEDYGLRQLAVAGLSPEAEPTPADLQRLIAVVKKEQVPYIFFETLTDPKIADLLAEATGAKTAVLDPLEGLDKEGREQGLDYITLMDRNIDALSKALNE